MAITIEPAEFKLVFFEVEEIRALVERLLGEVGLPADTDVRIEVDESTPMGRARLVATGPVTVQLESGALEDAKRPRHFSLTGAADVLGRLLMEARDRLDPTFGDPPPDAELSLLESAAWQTYCVGRLHRTGHGGQRQRRLYQFRTRHGFADVTDTAFEQLWNGTDLTWTEITELSRSANVRSVV